MSSWLLLALESCRDRGDQILAGVLTLGRTMSLTTSPKGQKVMPSP